MLPYSIKFMRHKIYVYVFAIQSMLCTDYELFDMFYNEIQFFGCKKFLRFYDLLEVYIKLLFVLSKNKKVSLQ